MQFMDILTAKNGALRDVETGRFVPGGKVTTAIDSPSMAKEYVQRRIDKKRETIAAAANDAVQRADYKRTHGDMAYVAELGYFAQLKAQNVDDPKQIDAARFILQETGISEPKQSETVNNTVNMFVLPDDVAQALVDLHATITSKLHDTDAGEVIDAG